MKVLNLTFDGFAPSSNLNVLELVNIDRISNKYGYSINNIVETTDPSRFKLWSHSMWCRLYSKLEPAMTEADRFNPNLDESEVWKQRYDVIPNDQWIWNKLARMKVTSYVFPYYLVRLITNKNLLEWDRLDRQYVNMLIHGYGTDKYQEVVDGEVLRKQGSSQYNYFSDIMDQLNKTYYPELMKDVSQMWKNYKSTGDESCIYPIKKITEDIMIPKMKIEAEDNLRMYDELVFPRIIELSNNNDNFYCNLGIVESDNFYHFFQLYEDCIDWMRSYYYDLVDRAISAVDPDILIIGGDHGCREQDEEHDKESGRLRYSGYITIGGRKRYIKKSHYSWTIFVNEHNNSNGFYVLIKDNSNAGNYISTRVAKLLEDNKNNEVPYLACDALYDIMCEEEFWKL